MFGLDDLLGLVSKPIETVVERLIPDKAKSQEVQDQIKLALVNSDIQGVLAQLDINKAEASNPNIFVAGWRPFIGWICGTALAYEYVLAPLGLWGSQIAGHPIPAPPMLDNTLWQLMFGMLGMGGLRTFEKVKGVASEH